MCEMKSVPSRLATSLAAVASAPFIMPRPMTVMRARSTMVSVSSPVKLVESCVV